MIRPRLPRSGTWGSVALEVGIVVVGILIAFALDSWWEGRAEADREQAHLRALRSDFARNVQRLRHHVALEEGVSEASLRLMRISRSGADLPRDSAANVLGPVFNSGRFEPVMGAYEGLVGSGDLPLIRDDSLRRALAEFASSLDMRYAERFADELYLSMMQEHAGRLGWMEWNAQHRDRLGIAPRPGWDPGVLLADPRFDDQLAARYLSSRDVAKFYRDLEERASRILHRVDAELEEEPRSAAGESPSG